jgi:hypothetical protein
VAELIAGPKFLLQMATEIMKKITERRFEDAVFEMEILFERFPYFRAY